MKTILVDCSDEFEGHRFELDFADDFELNDRIVGLELEAVLNNGDLFIEGSMGDEFMRKPTLKMIADGNFTWELIE